MKAHTILLSIGISFACAAVFDAKAQTCRVNSGYSANGCVNYLEVYEFDYVEVKPEFPGGGQSLVNFINDHRRYPAEAYARGVEGRVTCSFVVNTDGSVSNIKVIKAWKTHSTTRPYASSQKCRRGRPEKLKTSLSR